ncbi:MAG: hypothetical protein CML40_09735 [Rhodobacteraceae bacterium]|nr:MAG: hypothetical protein CML40_09735 [Paracoccaceae bacterium]|tara:strand:- start:197 stop:442 length:246 start_codon:yes stop_codon:yes gene_type:complete
MVDLAAQFKFANLYRKKISLAQDYKTAVNLYTFRAEHGNAVPQYKLGIMYNFGFGVIEDYETSLKWHILSAERERHLLINK